MITVYYDVPNRKARDGKTAKPVDVVMNFTSAFGAARFWEVRVSQIPFSQKAPVGCLQYFFGNEGTIQVFESVNCQIHPNSFHPYV